MKKKYAAHRFAIVSTIFVYSILVMTSWLFFTILSPVLWACSNVVDTVLRRHYIKSDTVLAWWFSASRLPFAVALLFFIDSQIPSADAVFWIITGGILWIVPMIFYLRALESEEPSRVILILNTDAIFTLVIAALMIDEKLTVVQGFAFILLFLGGTFAGLKKVEQKWKFSTAMLLMVLASLAWSTSDVIFKKYEMLFENFSSAFAFFFLGSAIPSLLIVFSKKMRDEIRDSLSSISRRGWLPLVATQITGIGGSLAFAYALTLGKASLTAVIMGIQPLIVFIFGLLLPRISDKFHKERLDKSSLIFKGISFILVMTGLIYLQQ